MKFTAVRSTRLVLFTAFVLLLFDGSPTKAGSSVVDNVNGDLSPPGFSTFPDQLGWVYTPSFDYTLDGVFSTFASIFGATTRDVELVIYDQPPAAGGNLLRSGTFSAGTDGGNLGTTFADLELQAGEDYFIGYEDIAGLGLNIVDFAVSLPPPDFLPSPDVEFLGGWYTDAGFTTFNSFAESPGFAAPILRFTGIGSSPVIASHWTGGDGNWVLPANWDTPHIPNNGGGDTYTAVIDAPGFPAAASINIVQDYVITNLDLVLGRIQLFGNASLTVLDQTTLGPSVVDFNGKTVPGASFVLRPLGTEQQLVDLGTLAAFSGNILTAGSYSLTARDSTSATIQWQGADIHQIGPDVRIFLTGPNAAIRNSDDASDALSNLQQNDGLLVADERGLSFDNSLTNNGQILIDEGISTGITTDPIGLSVSGDFTNDGQLVMQSESTSTFFFVGGNFDNSGGATIALTTVSAGPNPFNSTIGGDLSNSSGFTFSAGGQTATLTVGGDLSNTGTLSSSGAATTIAVTGQVAELVGGELTAGSYSTGAGTIAAAQFDVHTIAAGASVALGTPRQVAFNEAGGQLVNSTTGQSALEKLQQVDGELTVRNRNLTTGNLVNTGVIEVRKSKDDVDAIVTVDGTLSNPGDINVTSSLSSGPSATNRATLTATGPLLEQVGTTLTAGNYDVFAGDDTEASVAWAGANIATIGSEATVSLFGMGASILNSSNGADALAALTTNHGTLLLSHRDFSTNASFLNHTMLGETTATFEVENSDLLVNGNLTNSATANVSGVGNASNNSSVDGNLTNSGDFFVSGVAGATTVLSVSGDVTNTSEFDVSTLSSITGNNSVKMLVTGMLDNSSTLALETRTSGDSSLVSVQGGLVQQVNNVLEAGTFTLETDAGDGQSVIFEWTDADVHTIGSDAEVVILGPDSVMRDRVTLNNALANLADVQGSLRMAEQTFTTAGNLSVSGRLEVGAADLTVTGDFANNGTTVYTGDLSPQTFQIDGAFSNTGQLSGAFGGKITTNSPLLQQTGTTLTNGDFFVESDTSGNNVGEIAWAGAEITMIGPSAGIFLIGNGGTIRNSQNDADAVTGLEENQGLFQLRDRNHAFAGDFTNPGEMELVSAVTMNFPAGSQLTNSGLIDLFGATSIINAELVLTDSSEFSVSECIPAAECGDPLGSVEADTVRLDGDLFVILDELLPDPSDQFVILDAETLLGSFDNVANGQRIDTFDGSGSFLVTYDTTNSDVVLSDFVQDVFPGDFDMDGDVDGQDFLKWQRGESPNPFSQSDLADWETNYGSVAPQTATSAAVPEPSTIVALIILAVTSSLFRKPGSW